MILQNTDYKVVIYLLQWKITFTYISEYNYIQ